MEEDSHDELALSKKRSSEPASLENWTIFCQTQTEADLFKNSLEIIRTSLIYINEKNLLKEGLSLIGIPLNRLGFPFVIKLNESGFFSQLPKEIIKKNKNELLFLIHKSTKMFDLNSASDLLLLEKELPSIAKYISENKFPGPERKYPSTDFENYYRYRLQTLFELEKKIESLDLNNIDNPDVRVIKNGLESMNIIRKPNYQEFEKDTLDYLIDQRDELLKMIDDIEYTFKVKRGLKSNQVKAQTLPFIGKRNKTTPLNEYTYFIDGEQLNQGEGLCNEYKQYEFPFNEKHQIALNNNIVGFLNSDGGRIYIGITDHNFKVIGQFLNSKQCDTIRLNISNFIGRIEPSVTPDQVRVDFVPIVNMEMSDIIPSKWIVKIIVQEGVKDDIYSYNQGGIMSYMRYDSLVRLITGTDFKQMLRNRIAGKVKEKGLDYNDPKPEEGQILHDLLPVKRGNQLSQQSEEMKPKAEKEEKKPNAEKEEKATELKIPKAENLLKGEKKKEKKINEKYDQKMNPASSAQNKGSNKASNILSNNDNKIDMFPNQNNNMQSNLYPHPLMVPNPMIQAPLQYPPQYFVQPGMMPVGSYYYPNQGILQYPYVQGPVQMPIMHPNQGKMPEQKPYQKDKGQMDLKKKQKGDKGENKGGKPSKSGGKNLMVPDASYECNWEFIDFVKFEYDPKSLNLVCKEVDSSFIRDRFIKDFGAVHLVLNYKESIYVEFESKKLAAEVINKIKNLKRDYKDKDKVIHILVYYVSKNKLEKAKQVLQIEDRIPVIKKIVPSIDDIVWDFKLFLDFEYDPKSLNIVCKDIDDLALIIDKFIRDFGSDNLIINNKDKNIFIEMSSEGAALQVIEKMNLAREMAKTKAITALVYYAAKKKIEEAKRRLAE